MDSIRMLSLDGPHTGTNADRLDLRRWALQYPKVIGIKLARHPSEPAGRICAEEMLSFAGRVIHVYGTVRYHLPMEESAFAPRADRDLEWRGRLSLESVGASKEEQEDIFTQFYIPVDPLFYSPSRPPRTLGSTCIVRLKFPKVEMSLKVFETVLTACPRLEEISCVLTCPSDDAKNYMTRLTDLVRGPGAGLETIGPCVVKGANLLIFARHLIFLPVVYLEGVIDGDCIDTIRELHWVPEYGPGQMVLRPQPIARAGQHVDETINPYELAKVIRWVLGHTKVEIRQATEITLTDATAMWTRILSSIWKSFEKEDEGPIKNPFFDKNAFYDYTTAEDMEISYSSDGSRLDFWEDDEDESMLKDFWEAQEEAPVAEAFAGANGDEGTPV
jgi:hypothetical protein